MTSPDLVLTPDGASQLLDALRKTSVHKTSELIMSR